MKDGLDFYELTIVILFAYPLYVLMIFFSVFVCPDKFFLFNLFVILITLQRAEQDVYKSCKAWDIFIRRQKIV